MEKVIIYTTAPSDYDWSFTTELAANVGTTKNGKTIRKVEIQKNRADAQCDRYSSGLHMRADETEWAKLVDYKLVTVAA
jgi:hypothetical protein